MNKYEIMFIVRPDMEEAEIKRTAEEMKINIGCVYPKVQDNSMEVRGRNLISGLPITVEVNFRRPLKKEDITIRNLLKTVLLSSNQNFRTERNLIKETENLVVWVLKEY